MREIFGEVFGYFKNFFRSFLFVCLDLKGFCKILSWKGVDIFIIIFLLFLICLSIFEVKYLKLIKGVFFLYNRRFWKIFIGCDRVRFGWYDEYLCWFKFIK